MVQGGSKIRPAILFTISVEEKFGRQTVFRLNGLAAIWLVARLFVCVCVCVCVCVVVSNINCLCCKCLLNLADKPGHSIYVLLRFVVYRV